MEDFESGVKNFFRQRTASLQKEPIKELKKSQKGAEKEPIREV